MPFTTFKYKIKNEDTYEIIAKEILARDKNYSEKKDNSYLLKEIETGLKIFLKDKKLIPGETIVLMDSVEYYLKVTPSYTIGKWKGQTVRIVESRESSDNGEINHIQKMSKHLFFNIREYDDYKDYYWKEYTVDVDYERLHGQIGDGSSGITGDKDQYEEVNDGYVYLFQNNDLKRTFVIKNDIFQEVKLTVSDCSYTNKVGPERPCGMLYKHFDENGFGKEHYQFVFSHVKLNAIRLFGRSNADNIPQLIPYRFCTYAVSSNYDIRDLNRDMRSGTEILLDYRNKDKSVTLSNYNLRATNFKGYNMGISMYYPNPLKELKRRASIYQKRLQDLDDWVTLESRVQQKYLHTVIDNLVTNDKTMSRYADLQRMDAWDRAYRDAFNKLTHKVYYGAENLVAWLNSDWLNQCLLNHLASENKDDILEAVEAYQYALTDIDQHSFGIKFYKESFADPFSFINLVLGLDNTLAESKQSKILGVLINQHLLNADELGSSAVFARKAEQAVLNLAKKSAPAILKILGNKTFLKLAENLVQHAAGSSGKITTTTVQPLEKLLTKVEVLDLATLQKSLSKALNSKAIARIVVFFEAVNVLYAVKNLMNDPENRTRNIATVLGASLDFAADVSSQAVVRNWLFKSIKHNKWVTSNASLTSKIVPGMQFISGAIDCFVGIDSAVIAHKHGEIGLRNGYILFAVGGAISAVGAGMIIAGGKSAALSAGTLSVPAGFLITAGIIIEGIGLAVTAYWDNREIKDWIESSIFGDEPELNGDRIFPDMNNTQIIQNLSNKLRERSNKSITSSQIEIINEILCRFFIEVSFHHVKGKLQNTTHVNVEIEPGLITENAIIRFSNIKAIAEARWIEYLQPDNRHGLETGGAGSKNPTIYLEKVSSDPELVKRDAQGRIKKIVVNLWYGMDIDRLKGNVEIDFNNGTLQKLKKEFDESARFYE
ncbi:MAG: hypothetical protein MI922_22330 [Bacteroidales bacterium]|nr:hypothetical protein [Bacteroidales bacterium]